MEWWHSMMISMRRVWIRVAKRLGIRRTGLGKLRYDVKTCEYEDVHVLWEMLKRNEAEQAGPSRLIRKRDLFHVSEWARCFPRLCR